MKTSTTLPPLAGDCNLVLGAVGATGVGRLPSSAQRAG